MSAVLVATAKPDETAAVRRAFESAGGKCTNTEDAQRSEWSVAGLSILLIETGEGNYEARNAVAAAIRTSPRFDAAFMVGTCASMRSGEIGEIIVCAKVRHIKTWRERDGRIPKTFDELHSDRDLVKLATDSELQVGMSLAVDALIESAKTMEDLSAWAPESLALDMESGGFLAAAGHIPAVVLRSVMDHGGSERLDGETKLKNGQFAAERVASRLLVVLRRWNERATGLADLAATLIDTRDSPASTEADIVRRVLEVVESALDSGASLEAAPGSRGRIDVLIAGLVIEVERDLRLDAKLQEGEQQLRTQYLPDVAEQTSRTPTGIVTDGVIWNRYQLVGEELVADSTFAVTSRPECMFDLIEWIRAGWEAESQLAPTPSQIVARLGSQSSSTKRDRDALRSLWAQVAHNPEAQLKRTLWARSLRTALGSQFEDSDELFIDHTYLVLVAELIANHVMGIDPEADVSAAISGEAFNERQLHGVVEADFFDWVLHAEIHGQRFIGRLARRTGAFDWYETEHDVLKFLYESVIPPETRKALGEYYTPDWLASAVVADVVDNPASQTVLDPSCGSGTFLFHALKAVVAAHEEQGTPASEIAGRAASQVLGFDLHPVAVALARVTYLLAIGDDHLKKRSGAVTIPVFLADSMRWNTHRKDILNHEELVIDGDTGNDISEAPFQQQSLFSEFRFANSLLNDPELFETLLTHMAAAAERDGRGKKVAPGGLRRTKEDVTRFGTKIASDFALTGDEERTMRSSLAEMCRLVDEGRDGIWKYYIRNQARPAWLSSQSGGVDCIVGNPPWLRYSLMPREMQTVFKEMSQQRGLWVGGRVAHAQDLSSLFVARSVELYARRDTRFGFVLPDAVLRSKPTAGFREGDWSTRTGKGKKQQMVEQTTVTFHSPWKINTLAESFPFPSAVAFGTVNDDGTHEAMPFTMRVAHETDDGPVIGAALEQRPDTDSTEFQSPYGKEFRNGATLYPRMLIFVDVEPAPRGSPGNVVSVKSQRATSEKSPWKQVASLIGVVETSRVHPVYLGESLAPYRVLNERQAVLPTVATGIDEGSPLSEPGFAAFWALANEQWMEHRSDRENKSLLEQINYMSKLSSQYPQHQIRVIYPKSGTRLVAAILTNPEAIVENSLYWAALETLDEARYLTAVLNSETLRARTEAFQSRGLFGPRHFDKYPFVNPIPRFDAANPLHRSLVALAAESESVAETVELGHAGFQKARTLILDALQGADLSDPVDSAVAELLGDAHV